MKIATNVIFIITIIPIILLIIEVFLAKKDFMGGILLPAAVACTFVSLGFYSLAVAGVMFLIYFVTRYLEKEKYSKLSEIDKMNIKNL